MPAPIRRAIRGSRGTPRAATDARTGSVFSLHTKNHGPRAALACTAGLQALFARTVVGRSFRAVSDDREVAELMGLEARKVYALATALAFVLVAVAGVLQAMRTTVSPSDGLLLLLFAFEAVIIGGMGSFWGTLLGALLARWCSSYSTSYSATGAPGI
ncbi:ABC transporter permease subunit [Cupriavidus sp. TMH.W2]|uniref:ABC transporter permease subunit n=1 Tax=Cupriavidus sp. TMH.W2 TaxID=3434465 RepID=UPI003D76AC88